MRNAIGEAERQAMLDALEQTGDNATQAAKKLEWSRRKFVERMKRFGIKGRRSKG